LETIIVQKGYAPPNPNAPKERMTIILAMIAAFFGAPELYRLTIEFVLAFAESRYGPQLVQPVLFAWAVIVAAFAYYSARITFDIALMSALLALATRMF
jgi:hypothetical protein